MSWFSNLKQKFLDAIGRSAPAPAPAPVVDPAKVAPYVPPAPAPTAPVAPPAPAFETAPKAQPGNPVDVANPVIMPPGWTAPPAGDKLAKDVPPVTVDPAYIGWGIGAGGKAVTFPLLPQPITSEEWVSWIAFHASDRCPNGASNAEAIDRFRNTAKWYDDRPVDQGALFPKMSAAQQDSILYYFDRAGSEAIAYKELTTSEQAALYNRGNPSWATVCALIAKYNVGSGGADPQVVAEIPGRQHN